MRFLGLFFDYLRLQREKQPRNEEIPVQQAGPGYDPQAAVMRWLPLATVAILTPGGSILTRDVR